MSKILTSLIIATAIITTPAQALAKQVTKMTTAKATAICRDYTYSYSAHRQGTCSHHHGVLRWLK